MNEKEFKAKSHTLKNILDNSCDNYVFCRNSNTHTSVAVKGTISDLCYMTHELINTIREHAEPILGKEGADMLVRKISVTDDEINEELKKQKSSLPKFLRKLMDMESELDENDIDFDDEDEDDDAETESEDGSDCDEDECFECSAEKAVDFFVKHQALFKAICEVRRLCKGTPCSVVVHLDFDNDDRE